MVSVAVDLLVLACAAKGRLSMVWEAWGTHLHCEGKCCPNPPPQLPFPTCLALPALDLKSHPLRLALKADAAFAVSDKRVNSPDTQPVAATGHPSDGL